VEENISPEKLAGAANEKRSQEKKGREIGGGDKNREEICTDTWGSFPTWYEKVWTIEIKRSHPNGTKMKEIKMERTPA